MRVSRKEKMMSPGETLRMVQTAKTGHCLRTGATGADGEELGLVVTMTNSVIASSAARCLRS
jgi:hypothetical protein